jgi:hypothetical protein
MMILFRVFGCSSNARALRFAFISLVSVIDHYNSVKLVTEIISQRKNYLQNLGFTESILVY